jgi:hypothetical protein
VLQPPSVATLPCLILPLEILPLDVLFLLIMDYSSGIPNSMCSPFFPDLRKDLGPYLIDKTKLIENIVVNNRLTGHVDLVLRPRRSGKSTMLQMLK